MTTKSDYIKKFVEEARERQKEREKLLKEKGFSPEEIAKLEEPWKTFLEQLEEEGDLKES